MLPIGENLKVELSSYHSDFKRLDENTVYLKRTIFRRDYSSEIDTFGKTWSLSFAELESGQISIRRRNEKISMAGRVGIFLPQFSIVEWCYVPGTLSFGAYCSTTKLPHDFGSEPVVFSLGDKPFPSDLREAMQLMRVAKELILIGKEEKTSAIARRAKRRIQETYLSGKSLRDVAREIHVSHAEMTKGFRACYGCTPVFYRTRLRTNDSLWKILTSTSYLSTTALDVGFSDLSNFNKQFRSHYATHPSAFTYDTPAGVGEDTSCESGLELSETLE